MVPRKRYLIYIWIDKLNKLMELSNTNTIDEALHHCRMYFDSNHKDYLIYDDVKHVWMIWNPLLPKRYMEV